VANEKFLTYSFDGRVEKIEYTKQGLPYITVNGDEYYLDVGWNNNHLIQLQDSIKKDSGNALIILVKQKTGKVFKFESR